MPEPDITVTLVEDEAARSAAYAIRFEVFVDEQRVPPELELDELDVTADHMLVLAGGTPVATGRLVTEPPGFEHLDAALGPVAHLGRIAVRAPHRGTGVGVAVVRALEERAVAAGLAVAYLSGQVVAIGFYERLGYAAYGEVFDDAGIPHRHMTRRL
jgi:predicted GNAT family N-acyltransferase